ncbi:Transmembrane emp24 domain-containing protein p24delta3, partial [Mucuna pruriens]
MGRGTIDFYASLVLLLFFTTHFYVLPLTEALWLTIPSSGTKCLSEEIQTNVVVLADYYVVSGEGPLHPTVSVKVTSPYGNNFHHKENVTQGQFAFTTAESGNYVACFWLDGTHQEEATVSLEWKTGISAKDWESVAKKEKIEGVELELRKLEGAVEAIHGYLIYLKDKEARMREVSEKTNGRVAWFSIMSLGVCVLVSVLQVCYLKRFFLKKKLI